MAEHHGESKVELLLEKIADKIRGGEDSSSDSDNDRPSAAASLKSKVYRLFGRETPVHKLLGGGKPADVLLWRNKKVSAAAVGGGTVLWSLFEVFEYHLLTFICHLLILSLALLFLWSSASTFNRAPRHIPDLYIPERPVLQLASALRNETNRGIAALREVASGRDLKKLLYIIAGLWILSIIGSCCSFLTLFYIGFLLLLTLPVLYEKYEDQVDSFAEKALAKLKKQYAVFDAYVLSRIPRGPTSDKKKA